MVISSSALDRSRYRPRSAAKVIASAQPHCPDPTVPHCLLALKVSSAIAETVHEPAHEPTLDGQGRCGRRRDGTLCCDRLVVVGAHDRIDDLVLGVVTGALDLGDEPHQVAVADDLG